MNKFALVVVTYNRSRSLSRILGSLSNVDCLGRKDVTLIISCDCSGTDDCINIAKSFSWNNGEKIVRTFPNRQGLKKHILSCFAFAEEYDAVFVLEDDLVVSPSLFAYGSQACDFYSDCNDVAGISLYAYQKNWLCWPLRFEPQKGQYDNYFMKVGQSWGEIMTKKQWLSFKDWLSKNEPFVKDEHNPDYINTWPDSSWLKYWTRYCILENKYLVYPYHSLTTNCSDGGENNSRGSINDHQVDLLIDAKEFKFQPFDATSYNCVKYDEYMNRENLDSILNIRNEKLVTDLYGTRTNIPFCRYFLTNRKITKSFPIKSFPYKLRPVELSIQFGLEGNDIFLYDFKEGRELKNLKSSVTKKELLYYFRTNEYKPLFKTGFALLSALPKKMILALKRKCKKR